MGKAFLVKDWAGNYAGQTLTNVAKGTIPADVAEFYEDHEVGPNDVVKDEHAGGDPLIIRNGEADLAQVRKVVKAKQDKVNAAKAASNPASATAEEDAATQRRAHEADVFAAKQAAATPKVASYPKSEAGKEHGVK